MAFRSVRPVAVAGVAVALALLMPAPAGAQRIQLLTATKTVLGTGPGGDFPMELTCDPVGEPTEQTVTFELADGESLVIEDSTDLEMTFSSPADCTITELDARGAAEVQIVVASIPAELTPDLVGPLVVDLPPDATVLAETTVADPSGEVSLDFSTVAQDNNLDYIVEVVNVYGADACDTAEAAAELDALFGELLDGEDAADPATLQQLLADYEEAVAVARVSAPADLADEWGLLEQAVDAVDEIFAGVSYDIDALSEADVEALASIADEIAPATLALGNYLQDTCTPPVPTTSTTIPPRPAPIAPRFAG
jgi:hypothetical protein